MSTWEELDREAKKRDLDRKYAEAHHSKEIRDSRINLFGARYQYKIGKKHKSLYETFGFEGAIPTAFETKRRKH